MAAGHGTLRRHDRAVRRAFLVQSDHAASLRRHGGGLRRLDGPRPEVPRGHPGHRARAPPDQRHVRAFMARLEPLAHLGRRQPRAALNRANRRPVPTRDRPLPASIYNELIQVYVDDLRRLAKRASLDLSDWLRPRLEEARYGKPLRAP